MIQESPKAAARLCAASSLTFLAMFLALPATARERPRRNRLEGEIQRVAAELSGTLTAQDGQNLRLITPMGSVKIRTQNSGKVDYHVRVETDQNQPNAEQIVKRFRVIGRELPGGVLLRGEMPGRILHGNVWITFEVNVPQDFNLAVSTGGGNIDADDVRGTVSMTTAGGNIHAGSIAGSARLETGGGHITVRDVSGELNATTGGGHITAGNVAGNAILHTGGGHLRAVSVRGIARLETAGGNISLEKAKSELVAETGGGQIEVGDAAGKVHARTGGGGIRVVNLAGPTQLETGSGSIFLTQVNSAVRATTGEGGITAWFASDARLPSPCQLESAGGDINVYIPKQLPLTVDVLIQQGDDHRLIVDPSLPLKVSYEGGDRGHAVRAQAELNGGGEMLRLRTVAGNIRLILSDAARQVEILNQQMLRIQQQLRAAQASALPSPTSPPALPRQPEAPQDR